MGSAGRRRAGIARPMVRRETLVVLGSYKVGLGRRASALHNGIVSISAIIPSPRITHGGVPVGNAVAVERFAGVYSRADVDRTQPMIPRNIIG